MIIYEQIKWFLNGSAEFPKVTYYGLEGVLCMIYSPFFGKNEST